MFSVVYFAMAMTPLCCFAAKNSRGRVCIQMYTRPGRFASGGDFELDRGGVAGEHLGKPQISADRRARAFQRLDLARAAREASRQVDDLRDVASVRAMDR